MLLNITRFFEIDDTIYADKGVIAYDFINGKEDFDTWQWIRSRFRIEITI